MSEKLKFEGFQIGDRIQAYDFEPRDGCEDRYVIGTIVGFYDELYKAYRVKVEDDTVAEPGVREVVLVPFEITFDYDNRVQLLEPICPNCRNSAFDGLADQGYGGAFCDNCNDLLGLNPEQRRRLRESQAFDAYESGRPMGGDE